MHMSDQSLLISEQAASELTALALAGLMTGATFTELAGLILRSLSNVKTIEETTSPVGLTNSAERLQTLADFLGQ
jgi:hypothetical protein